MSNHTPGPWVRCKEAPKIIMSGSFIDGHEGYIVGSVSGNDNSGFYASEEEAEANACLIAAAPDLLSIVQRLVALDAQWHPDRHASEKAELMEEARAAIAKARVKP